MVNDEIIQREIDNLLSAKKILLEKCLSLEKYNEEELRELVSELINIILKK